MERIESSNEYLSIYKYDYNEKGVMDQIRAMLGKETRPFVIVCNPNLHIYTENMKSNNLLHYIDYEMVEFKTRTCKYPEGEEIDGRQLGKVERLKAIFPSRMTQINEAKTPYVPNMVMYATKFLKATISHIPPNLHNLNFGLQYLLQVIAYIKDVGVDRKQTCVNDKLYGVFYAGIPYTKSQVTASSEYIARILQDAGVKTEFFESFAYWSKECIKKAHAESRISVEDKIYKNIEEDNYC